MQIIAVDTETDLIVPGRLAPRLTCVTWADQAGNAGLLDHHDARAWLTATLANPDIAIVGANIAYDAAVIGAEYPELVTPLFKAYEAGRVLDVRLREQLIDIATDRLSGVKGHYTLKGMCERRLQLSLDKDTHRLGYGPLRYVPIVDWPAGARTYATDDAKATLAVYASQHEQADDYHDDLQPYALVNELPQTRAAFALQLMSVWGVRTSRARIDILEALLTEEFVLLKAKLVDLGILQQRTATRKQTAAGIDPGVRKSRSAITALVEDAYEEMGENTPRTAGGGVATDRKTLIDTGRETLRLTARYGEIEKLLSTYIPMLRRGQDVPINTYFGLANSGRVTASPNTQNLPRASGPRECFVARPGTVLCSVDYETAELRALAAFCEERFGYSAMAVALREGKDLHTMLAAALVGVEYDYAMANSAELRIAEARQLAKACNFGLAGGMGAQRFVDLCAAQGIIITLNRAKQLKAAWLAQWPEMADFFALAAEATAMGQGDVETPWSKRLRANCYYSEWCNHHMQAPIADAAKAAAFALAYECYTGEQYPGVPGAADGSTPLKGARPVLFLHDELMAELIDDDTRTAAALRMAQVMRAVAERTVKTVPMPCEPALMTAWSKSAKTTYKHGELVAYVA